MLFKKTPVLVADAHSNRPISLIVGSLAFVMTLMIAGILALNHFVGAFQRDLKNNLVFEVNFSGTDASQESQILTALQQTLHSFPPVKEVNVIPFAKNGAGQSIIFIEASIHTQAPLSLDDMVSKMRNVHSQTYLQSHAFVQANLSYLYQSLKYFSFGIIALISLTIIGTISLVTRSGLRMHRHVIDILRLIGAPNNYIAGQFQWIAFRLGFLASLGGVLMALLIFAALTFFGERFGLSKDLVVFDQNLFTSFICLPLFIAGVSLFVARFEVIRTLIKLEV